MAEEKKLISVTDENAILISAEFMQNLQRTKNGPTKLQSYCLDLIVNNSITCNELMDSIRYGLLDKIHFLSGSKNIKLIQIARSSFDSRNPADKKDIVYKYNIEKAVIAASQCEDLSMLNRELSKTIISSDTIIEDNEPRTLQEIEIYFWCLLAFAECMEIYCKMDEIVNYSEDVPEERVSRGSINCNELAEGEELSFSHEDQIWLIEKQHGEIELKKLGFMTSTRLVFDLSGKERTTFLFQNDEVCEGFREQVPLYNISDQPLFKLDSEAVNIIPPTDPPTKSRMNLIVAIVSPLLMTGAMLLARNFYSSGSGMTILSIFMAAATIGTVVLNFINQQISYKRAVAEWKKHYEDYIQRTIKDICDKQRKDVRLLKKLYPPKIGDRRKTYTEEQEEGLVELAAHVSSSIFSRRSDHPDYLTVRLGLSKMESQLVPSVFPIVGKKEDVVFTAVKYNNIEEDTKFTIIMPKDAFADDNAPYLTELPLAIATRYKYLSGAPVLLNLKSCGCLGIIFPHEKSFKPFLDNIILDLCFYHAPEDVQCIWFCKKTDDWLEKQTLINSYKHLPHFRELLGNLSAFAFEEEDASMILNRLFEVLNTWKERASEKHAHVVMIIEEEYGFKRHPVADYLPKHPDESNGPAELNNNSDISFIFCKRYKEQLPKYCGQIILAEKTGSDKNGELTYDWFLLPHIQFKQRQSAKEEAAKKKNMQYGFIPDMESPVEGDLDNKDVKEQYYRAFKIISALYYERIAQGIGVPSRVELFTLYKNISDFTKLEETGAASSNQKGNTYFERLQRAAERDISENWGRHDVTKSLAVYIGKKTEASDLADSVKLDLHETADGPHMLVAGTTGSGKTETILTFLIGLCMTYTPEEVNLLLVDMKAGEFVNRLKGLPHIVGTVTDVDGDENGTGSSYMLNRFLLSMESEIKHRKLLLNQMGVDNIDKYIEAKRNIDEYVAKLELSEKDRSSKKAELEKLPPMAHLFMVVDEFTELMRFSSENGDIDFKKAITSLARIGRSLGFHIILVSQNIESAITDDIRVNSRARLCLRVATREASKAMIGTDLAGSPLMPGNGRAYLLVGTGSRFEYFQSAYSGDDIAQNIIQPVIVTHAEMNGRYSLFYKSDEQNLTIREANRKNKHGISQLSLLVRTIIEYADKEKNTNGMVFPDAVFQPPLPQACYYDFYYDNENGRCVPLRMDNL